MSRSLYIWIFVACAAIFVPVMFDFGLISYVVPTGFMAVKFVYSLFGGDGRFSLGIVFHLLFYLLLFYGAARLSFLLFMRTGSRTIHWAVPLVVVVSFLSCSFLRVITYSSIQGQGGSYTFWGAASRYVERGSR